MSSIAHPSPALTSEKNTFTEIPTLLKNTSPESAGNSDTGSEHSTVEKGIIGWEGYDQTPLPEKTQGHFARNARHQIFSLYRRLFGVVFATNMGVLIATFVKGGLNVSAQHLGLIVISNLFVSIVMRQDYVINAWFLVFTSVPLSFPLFIRRIAARVHHIGGFHSGCAVSGTIWFIPFTVQATREMANGGKASPALVGVAYAILTLLIGMLILAYPAFRRDHHDAFERTHRFAGWSATALFWCLVLFLVRDYKAPELTLGKALVKSAPFWLLLILTLSIISSWLRLRKVNVRAEVLSNHAVRYYFDYVNRTYPGQFIRLSDKPLTEWHSFAAIAVPGVKGYSAVLSRAGDWTSGQISEPPSKIWVRGVPCYGALTVSCLFRRVVFVATGSGIGPIAPWIFDGKVPSKLLWTAPNVRQTFGDNLVDAVLKAAPDAVIYDTRTHGKPDMVKLVYHLVKETNAEAVCIISNQKLTEKVVYGMMSRGIPAIGAIWDS
ncbi:Adenylate-forming domain-containing protein [Abortiporus biennis]